MTIYLREGERLPTDFGEMEVVGVYPITLDDVPSHIAQLRFVGGDMPYEVEVGPDGELLREDRFFRHLAEEFTRVGRAGMGRRDGWLR